MPRMAGCAASIPVVSALVPASAAGALGRAAASIRLPPGWPARSRTGGERTVGGGGRGRSGCGGSEGGGSCGVRRALDRTGPRIGGTEAAHGPVSAFQAAVVLLQPIVEVAAGPVPHRLAQLGADGARIAVAAVGGGSVRRYTRDGLGGAEERLRRRHVAAVAEQHIDERAGAVDGPYT